MACLFYPFLFFFNGLFGYFLIIFYCYAIRVVPISPPFAILLLFHPRLPQSIPTLLSMSTGHSYMFFAYSLPLLSTIDPAPLPSGHFQSVPCFHACASILFISLLFIRFLLKVRSYGICLSLSCLFHVVLRVSSSIMPSQKVWVRFFFLLHSISLFKCTTVFHPLIYWWAFKLLLTFGYCK